MANTCSFRPCTDSSISPFFFFNDTATTEIYTLSLHDALPICQECVEHAFGHRLAAAVAYGIRVHVQPDIARQHQAAADRKSTRLNSSHSQISYAVFCLKKKNRHLWPTLSPRRRCCVPLCWCLS